MTHDAGDFRLLFEQSPDELVVLLPDAPRFTQIAATEAWLRATQTTREQTIGVGLFENACGTAELRASLECVLATRAADTMAVQKHNIPKPDGTSETKYSRPKNIPVLAPTGEIRYILHRVDDVTELVHATELGKRELEAFSRSVSHDLRAPLQHITSFSEILAKELGPKLDERGNRYLGIITAAVERMRTMLDSLLTLGRLSRAPLSLETVDLGELAATTVTELQRSNPARQVTVAIEEGLAALCDRRLIGVALASLLGNAWKFTAKKPAARIEVGRAGGPVPTFFVRDNGAGFDMKYAEKLFQPFQRLHTVDEFEGTGVGLATAQRAIARHGGQIWAQAAVGEGACFFFTLPQ